MILETYCNNSTLLCYLYYATGDATVQDSFKSHDDVCFSISRSHVMYDPSSIFLSFAIHFGRPSFPPDRYTRRVAHSNQFTIYMRFSPKR